MMEVENNVAEHFEGDCAVHGDYEDLPDELNQSKDNGDLAEEGEDDDLQADASLLLESKIQSDTAYQKQQETLIVWSEGDNFDLALSFQEKAGCDEIWEKICSVQGKISKDFLQYFGTSLCPC